MPISVPLATSHSVTWPTVSTFMFFMISSGSCGLEVFLFFCAAGFIIAAKSTFDFDSTPPIARIRPSGLNAKEVTVRPIVPADIEPMMFVIMLLMAERSGICGILPGLPRLIFFI